MGANRHQHPSQKATASGEQEAGEEAGIQVERFDMANRGVGFVSATVLTRNGGVCEQVSRGVRMSLPIAAMGYACSRDAERSSTSFEQVRAGSAWDPFGTTRHARPRTMRPVRHVINGYEPSLTCENVMFNVLGVKGSQVRILSARRS
jgi:uncharacterized DUF497 family protein